jgi:hypothetical protein
MDQVADTSRRGFPGDVAELVGKYERAVVIEGGPCRPRQAVLGKDRQDFGSDRRKVCVLIAVRAHLGGLALVDLRQVGLHLDEGLCQLAHSVSAFQRISPGTTVTPGAISPVSGTTPPAFLIGPFSGSYLTRTQPGWFSSAHLMNVS